MRAYVLVNPLNNRLKDNKIPGYPTCLPEYAVIYGPTSDMGITPYERYRNGSINTRQSYDVCCSGYCAYLGHLKALLSHLDNYPDEDLLIMEDDVQFNKNFDTYYKNFMKKVPDDWDAIYFGGWCRGTAAEVVPDVLKLTGIHGLECTLLRAPTVKLLVNELIPTKNKGGRQVDITLSEMTSANSITTYRPIVPFAMQPPNYSAHIKKRINRTRHYFEKYINIEGKLIASSSNDYDRYKDD